MVQNPTYWRVKECDENPLGNVNKEKLHFSSYLSFVFCSSMAYRVPCDLQLQKAYCIFKKNKNMKILYILIVPDQCKNG